MDVILTTVAGIDVHKESLAITVLTSTGIEKPSKEQFECSTFTIALEECAKKLVSLGVQHVVLESTGIYWKPVYNVFIKYDLIITLGNAAHVKNVPGRKTDMNDSYWLAYLHRHGFIKPSFIPEEKFQDLRLITRHRNTLLSEQSRIKNRVQKILEDGNVKLSVVINDIFGVSGLAVLELIASGETDATKLCSAIKTNVKRSKEEIIQGLYNCLRESHCFLIKTLLTQYKNMQAMLDTLNDQIDNMFKNDTDVLSRLSEIPGISERLAENILAEATTEVEHFKDDRSFAAWAGVAPGNNESANKKKACGTRKGNLHLKHYLVLAAVGAIKTKGSYYRAKHNRLRFALGSYNKATMAIANRLARAVFHIISKPGEHYKELGEDRVDKKEQQIKRALKKLKELGVEVQVSAIN